MRNTITSFLLIIVSSLFIFCTLKNTGDKEELKFVVPEGWPKPTYDFEKNPIRPEIFSLGRKLFYDPVLSRDSSTSCSSCHLQYTNFTHIDHSLSHGINGRIGSRNTLSIVNMAWNTSFMWDGGINHLEVQALAPIENPDEMDSSMKDILKKLNNSESYKKKFRKAFGGGEITGQNFLKALTQYMLMLESYNSKYDRVMRKEKGIAFNEYELKGLTVFRQHCESCHREPLFTNGGFENNGLEIDPTLNDYGRIKITGKKEDSLKFKVPTLRNIELSQPYMHDGRYKNLQMVLFHYSAGIAESKNKSDKIHGAMPLSEEDKGNLIAFMKTLTDESFLQDKRFSYSAE